MFQICRPEPEKLGFLKILFLGDFYFLFYIHHKLIHDASLGFYIILGELFSSINLNIFFPA